MTLFAGCYTDPDFPLDPRGKGLTTLEWDSATGNLKLAAETSCLPNPSYLAVSADGHFLYAVHEILAPGPAPQGKLSVHRIAPGGLEFLGAVDSGGFAPCHLAVEPEGRGVLVSHYGSGTVVRSLLSEGVVGPVSAVGPEGGRHAHMALVGPDPRFVYAVDLGADQVGVGPRHPQTGAPESWRFVATRSGTGPRHLVFSSSGTVAYVVGESSGTVEAYAVDAGTGLLERFQTVDTLPEGDRRPAGCGAIRLSASGRHLLVSNRLGVDTVTVFAIDPTGRLSNPIWIPSGGSNPRDFVFDPTGNFVLVGNLSSGMVTVFRFDDASGNLDPVSSLAVPGVTCLVFCPEEPARGTGRRLPTRDPRSLPR